MRHALLLVATLSLSGCWGWDRFDPRDLDASVDARVDAGVDAGRADSGPPPDVDGGGDAGPRDDGGAFDGGSSDGGSDASVDGGCGGCIGSSGTCVAGTSPTECGAGGVECTTCGCPGDTCVDGRCVPSAPVVDVSTNANHICAALDDGSLRCIGSNDNGQLGITPIAAGSGSPTWIDPGFSGYRDVEVGGRATYVRDASDEIAYVGSRPGATTTQSSTPAPVGAPYDSMQAGHLHVCALRGGTLSCAGENGSGELGDGTADDRTALLPLAGTAPWIDVSLGLSYTCAIRLVGAENQLFCWGINDEGQLGLGDLTPRDVPTRVGTDVDWSAIAVGKSHTCGVRGGRVYCWGENGFAQSGAIGPTRFTSPRGPIQTNAGADLDDVVSLVAGRFHTCAVRSDGSMWCWGSNVCGELGRGDMGTARPTAGPVVAAPTVRWTVHDHLTYGSCAIAEGGALYCWGRQEGSTLVTESSTCPSSPPPTPTRVCF